MVIRAVEMAIWQRQGGWSVILHSDRGCQFRSSDYQDFLKRNTLVCSMSTVGHCRILWGRILWGQTRLIIYPARRSSSAPTCFLRVVSTGSLFAVRSKMTPPANAGAAQTQY